MTNCRIGSVGQKLELPSGVITKKLNLATSELQFELTGNTLLEVEDLRIGSKGLKKLKDFIDPYFLRSITFCGTLSLMP